MDASSRRPEEKQDARETGRWPRRRVLAAIAATGLGTGVFGRALVTLAQDAPRCTIRMIRQAEWISGHDFTREERELMLAGVNDALKDYAAIRAVPIDNAVPPALHFHPAATAPPRQETRRDPIDLPPAEGIERPPRDEDLAFAPVTTLAALMKRREISSRELTRLYLDRLRRHDATLACVISYTEDLALAQAEAADREIAAGRWRGPLHGIPWGAKDLISVPGYRTTWGATPYKDQERPEKATVVARLEEAGAVLIAKLTVGALAWGDVWFGGTTKNPWKTDQGSSGSSAGSASATAAGLTGFALGTETWGSIVSPCTRCGVSGLRPTFGRVSRHGCMALSWSMDKIGPIARSVRDLALVFHAIHGADGHDAAAVDRPFRWPAPRAPRDLKVGYVADLFEKDRGELVDDEEGRARLRESQEHDRRTLEEIRGLGVTLVPIRLPDAYPVREISFILSTEAATAFDDLTRSGRDDLLVRQIANAWPNVFRVAQMHPAVEYLRANRIRTLVMRARPAIVTAGTCSARPA